jgi:opacity protein-like surface antigen
MRTLPLVLLLSLPGIAAAQSADRTGTWEAGVKLLDTSHEFVEGEEGASLDVEGELAWGFFGSYNINEHFAVSGEITWSDPDYLAEFPLQNPITNRPSGTVIQVDAELDIWSTEFKAVFNLPDRGFTPFAEIGYGWTVVDSNIQDGPAETGCWWDPWWGYMCASFYDTYESTLTSLTYAVGLRWDMSDTSVLKASYGIRETDLDRAEDLEQDIFSIDFAWKF